MRTKVSLLAAIALVAVLLVPAPSSAQAQHQNANLYAYWGLSGNPGYWNMDQSLQVVDKAKHSFWANTWFWTGTHPGGYVGLQTNGQRFDGTTGDTAIFSLQDATAASGPSCGTFGGEGTGYSCRLAFPIRNDRWYRLRVWRADADDQGQWWGAWIKDKTTGQERFIGSIRVAPEHTLMDPPRNFSEYFGPAVACDSVPVSIVKWTRPTGNDQRQTATLSDKSRGECTGGFVRRVDLGRTDGVKIKQGGPL